MYCSFVTTFKWKLRLWWVRMRVGILKRKLVMIQRRLSGQENRILAHQMDLPLHG